MFCNSQYIYILHSPVGYSLSRLHWVQKSSPLVILKIRSDHIYEVRTPERKRHHFLSLVYFVYQCNWDPLYWPDARVVLHKWKRKAKKTLESNSFIKVQQENLRNFLDPHYQWLSQTGGLRRNFFGSGKRVVSGSPWSWRSFQPFL